jgi:hypothetical protein
MLVIPKVASAVMPSLEAFSSLNDQNVQASTGGASRLPRQIAALRAGLSRRRGGELKTCFRKLVSRKNNQRDV